ISPVSGREVKKDDVTDVVEAIASLQEGDKVLILVPFRQQVNRDVKEELSILLQKGFSRLYSDRQVHSIEDLLDDPSPVFGEDALRINGPKGRRKKEAPVPVYLLIDRLVVKDFDEDD